MLSIFRVFVLFLIMFFMSSCKTEKKTETLTSTAQTCSNLDGAWVACQTIGATSARTTWIVNGFNLEITTEVFNTNTTCAGAPSINSTAIYTFLTGTMGRSTYVSGATDFELRRAGADLGCGVDEPVYDRMLLNQCESFKISDSGPKCDRASVSTSINNGPYIRQ